MSSGQGSNFRGPTQLELGFDRRHEPDRNHEKGGRSFYFFDLDDNVFSLPTPIFVYDRDTGEQIPFTTGEFAKISSLVGKPGPYERFTVNPDDRVGSFRRFRDVPAISDVITTQPFVEDVALALEMPDYHWKGPSWDCFHYAVFNQRPMSLITARGHHPNTIREGIRLLCKAGFIPCEPNYLDIFPVSHPETRVTLGDTRRTWSTAELKKTAIIRCVENAMLSYGANPYHRFGMSDDDAHNIKLITEAKRLLKARYPRNSFYVIHADKKPFTKEEILSDHTQTTEFDNFSQLDFFAT